MSYVVLSRNDDGPLKAAVMVRDAVGKEIAVAVALASIEDSAARIRREARADLGLPPQEE
jgi:hypothetical protein